MSRVDVYILCSGALGAEKDVGHLIWLFHLKDGHPQLDLSGVPSLSGSV